MWFHRRTLHKASPILKWGILLQVIQHYIDLIFKLESRPKRRWMLKYHLKRIKIQWTWITFTNLILHRRKANQRRTHKWQQEIWLTFIQQFLLKQRRVIHERKWLRNIRNRSLSCKRKTLQVSSKASRNLSLSTLQRMRSQWEVSETLRLSSVRKHWRKRFHLKTKRLRCERVWVIVLLVAVWRKARSSALI